MKGYVVCIYKSIGNEKLLKEYAESAIPAIEKYKGKIIVRGGKKLTIEGKDSPRTVVIEFPSFEEAKNYYYSKEYQKAHSFLKGTVVRDLQIVEGP
tara:strand:- start:1356 stop:1643 length:288 start_codon:yes stop_codon:yes gene_type:complete